MPQMRHITAGKSHIKVSVVCLYLALARPIHIVIMADSTTGYRGINRMPLVIACSISNNFPQFPKKKNHVCVLCSKRGKGMLAKAQAAPLELSTPSMLLQALVWFCQLTVTLAGRGLDHHSLEMSMGYRRGKYLLGVTLFCELCDDLAMALYPLGRAREREVEGHDPCGARVGQRC